MPRKQHDYHYIYKTVNLINEKFYIGMHSTSNLEDGYIGSGKRLWYSIKKYGKENFKMEILEFLPDRSSLKEREKEIVNSELLKEDLCMNLKIGGEGGGGYSTWPIESRKLFSKKGLERRREVQKTDEYRSKMSEAIKLSIKEGNNHLVEIWKGRKHKPETIEKFKETRKQTSKGDKNSQFGTCWITNDIESKKILKGDLIPENWRLGRKIK